MNSIEKLNHRIKLGDFVLYKYNNPEKTGYRLIETEISFEEVDLSDHDDEIYLSRSFDNNTYPYVFIKESKLISRPKLIFNFSGDFSIEKDHIIVRDPTFYSVTPEVFRMKFSDVHRVLYSRWCIIFLIKEDVRFNGFN